MHATLVALFRHLTTMRSHLHPNHCYLLLLHDWNKFNYIRFGLQHRSVQNCAKRSFQKPCPEILMCHKSQRLAHTTGIPFPPCLLLRKKIQQLTTPMLWQNTKHSGRSEVKTAWSSQGLTWCDFSKHLNQRCNTANSCLSDLITAFPELRWILNCFSIRWST